MQLTLKNKDLITFLTVLRNLSVTKMKVNRGRAKLLRHVTAKLEEYAKDEWDILQEYVVLDEQGNLSVNEAGNFTLKDLAQHGELNDLLTELQEENVVLSFGEYKERYQAFFAYLAEAEDNFTAEQVLLIDELLDQVEKGDEA